MYGILLREQLATSAIEQYSTAQVTSGEWRQADRKVDGKQADRKIDRQTGKLEAVDATPRVSISHNLDPQFRHVREQERPGCQRSAKIDRG